MNAAEFASMIHRDLASQAASAFAVAKSPVSQKDEDEEHEKRLHRMTRAGSPCSSGDEGSPQASPQKPVAQAVVEVKAPSNPTTPRRRPSRNTRSSLPTTPSQRGPFGAVATELAAEVIKIASEASCIMFEKEDGARATRGTVDGTGGSWDAGASGTDLGRESKLRKRYLRVQAQFLISRGDHRATHIAQGAKMRTFELADRRGLRHGRQFYFR